jgi:hypothetical protein
LLPQKTAIERIGMAGDFAAKGKQICLSSKIIKEINH